MSFPFQLGSIDDMVASSGYEDAEANAYEAGITAGVELLSQWFQDRLSQDLTDFRGQVSRVYNDLVYQMKWINDQLNDGE